MHLKELELINFRNYQRSKFEFHPKSNIIFGKNAQGKTNILEAVYVLATLQSFRPVGLKGLIRALEGESRLDGHFVHGEIEKRLSLDILPRGKKPRINNKIIQKSADYFGLVPIICFHPMDLQILQGAPRLRRRFLDRAIFNFDPTYAVNVGNFYRALLQRNAALRFERWDMVEAWGEKMHRLGANVLLKRLHFIDKLNTLTSCFYKEISGLEDDVSVQYTSEVLAEECSLSEQDLFAILCDKQKEVLSQERRYKRSMVGPHRDDFFVSVGGNDLRSFGSQGEQRTAILSLKLSESAIMEADRDLQPIFLLDDISSELDDSRRNKLFDKLQEKDTQVFVTTTDIERFKYQKQEAALFRIEKGNVITD